MLNIYIVGQHLANGADNRVLTATSAYGLNGEANLTFDGTSLKIGNTFSPHSEGDNLVIGGSGWKGMTIYGEGGGGVIQFADDANNRVGQILYNHSTNEMLFRTNGNADRFEIQSGGDVTITNGNLIVGTGGKGIDLSAQTVGSVAGVSVNSELLDHYEEGTFTPFISASSSAPSVSYGSERGGKYTRIGNMVFYSLGFQMSSYSGGSGNVYIGGFPYIGSGTPGWDGAHVFRDCSAIGLNSRTNTLGAWMNQAAVSGYPILYIQSHSSTSNFGADFIQANSITTGRITIHGQYKIG